MFWSGKRVLLTGHTGFKGSWTTLLLERLNAKIFGFSLAPPTTPNLFDLFSPWSQLSSTIADIRDRKKLAEVICAVKPEVVIHMAAQPLVRQSYQSPFETMETNIMGTVSILEELLSASGLLGVLVITTDKVYSNHNEAVALRETAPLGGSDPYSGSKAAVEIVIAAYAQSFFKSRGIPVLTARAGNVIGGGDWAQDRIIPDLWRAYETRSPIPLRYPHAVRPWQHVLDPVYGYLLYLEHMISNPTDGPLALNFGPPIEPVRTVLDLAKRFSDQLDASNLFSIGSIDANYRENHSLSIDPTLAKQTLGWHCSLDVDTAIDWTCRWYRAFSQGENMRKFSLVQIDAYFDRLKTQASKTTLKLLNQSQSSLNS